jgi:lysozyme family protein
MDRFHNALALVFGAEGGVSNNPHDKGGLTALGVTAATWAVYCTLQGLPHTSVATITHAQAVDVYRRLYWDQCHAGACPTPLAEMVMDASVNSGPGRAVRLLQQALGVVPDGLVGPRTLKALAAGEPKTLALRYLHARESFLRGIATGDQHTFLAGWLHRIEHLRAYVETAP